MEEIDRINFFETELQKYVESISNRREELLCASEDIISIFE